MSRPRSLVPLAVLILACDEKPAAPAPSAKPTSAPVPTPAAIADAAPEAKPSKPKKKLEDCVKGPNATFDDEALEAEVRFKLQKPTGTISNAELGKIKSINLSQKRLDQLDPCIFPHFKQLNSLYLGAGGLDDLSPIATLTGLTSLRASINEVSDLAPLAGMKKMDRLDLGQTKVKDVSALGNMTELTDLQLDSAPVEDISALAKCTKLEQLSIQRTHIKDLSPLKGLKSLKTLRMAGTEADTFVLMPLAKEGLKILE